MRLALRFVSTDARGAMLAESIVAVVPHRHFTFTIPHTMSQLLRPYFRFHRGLLKQLCGIVH